MILSCVGGIVCAAIVVLILVIATSDDVGLADEPGASPEAAATVELPAPSVSVAGAVDEFLSEDGVLVMRFEDIADPLARLSSSSDARRQSVCRSVADQLDDEVAVEDLLDVAVQIPDQMLADLVLSHVTSVGRALTTCLNDQNAGPPLHEALRSVEAADVLVERRLGQM